VYDSYFHVGILVRDVEAARADFGALVGVEFEPVSTIQVASGETIRYCYSLGDSPYLELMEMTGTGSWSPEQGEGLHHLGLSDPSVPDRCAASATRRTRSRPTRAARRGWRSPGPRHCTACDSNTSTSSWRPG